MLPRFAAFVIWAAVAASAVYWALQLWSRPIAAPAHAVLVSAADGFHGDASRVLGTDAVPVGLPAAEPAQADPRFRLVGVVAPRAARAGAPGVALIATDGKPAKAYRVGAVVDGELVLQAVRSRGASLGPRGQEAQVDLQLPVLSPPPGSMPARPAIAPLPRAQQAVPPVQNHNPDVETPSDPADRPMLAPPGGALRPPA
ncbi:MAG TPA: hypothetical protein PKB14_23510 [Rubrivivax sp.]|nr:hypothetical protein [Rubrivivax sp.]